MLLHSLDILSPGDLLSPQALKETDRRQRLLLLQFKASWMQRLQLLLAERQTEIGPIGRRPTNKNKQETHEGDR